MANEIKLFGVIGKTPDGLGITAREVKLQLAEMDQSEPLVVRIDSDGGSVFDGLSIYEAFRQYPGPKKAVIESTAFSIASYIAMAFDEVEIAANGYVMIHEPSSNSAGTAGQLRSDAETLAKLDVSMVEAYMKKTGMGEEEIRSLMVKESFLCAIEAKSLGFVDTILGESIPTQLSPDARRSKEMPQRVFAALFSAGSGGGNDPKKSEEKPMADSKPVAATIKEIKAAYPKMKDSFYVRCLEKELPIASVATAAVEELMEENAQLTARIAELEEESKARAQEDEEATAKTKAEGGDEPEAEEDDEPVAKATASSRVRPVAKSTKTKAKAATPQWDEAVESYIAKGHSRLKAVTLANRNNPGLRERMLAEFNSR